MFVVSALDEGTIQGTTQLKLAQMYRCNPHIDIMASHADPSVCVSVEGGCRWCQLWGAMAFDEPLPSSPERLRSAPAIGSAEASAPCPPGWDVVTVLIFVLSAKRNTGVVRVKCVAAKTVLLTVIWTFAFTMSDISLTLCGVWCAPSLNNRFI